MKIKILSAVLAVLLCLNIFCFKCHASATAAAISGIIANSIASYGANLAAHDASELGAELGRANNDLTGIFTIGGTNPLNVSVDNGKYRVEANPDFEFFEEANFLAEQFNYDELFQGLTAYNSDRLSASDYSAIKNSSIEAYNNLLAAQVIKTQKAMDSLTEASAATEANDFLLFLADPFGFKAYADSVVPPYSILPTVSVPAVSKPVDVYNYDGITFYKMFTRGVDGPGETGYEVYGMTGWNGVWHEIFHTGVYAYGGYTFYNGVLYMSIEWSSDSPQDRQTPFGCYTYSDYYYDFNGNPLSSIIYEIPGLAQGLWVAYAPFTKPLLSSSDFIESSGGSTISLDFNDSESTLAQAIASSLVSADPELVVDENGNIVSADGVSIAHLALLLEDILANTDNIKDYDSYLQTIVTLLKTNNLSEDNIKTILSNVSSDTSVIATAMGGISGSIDTINENISSISASIAVAEAKDIEYDEASSFDFSAYILEHTGLLEAQEIVDNLDLIGQLKGLINNLFDPFSSKYNSTHSAPNFYFYWDVDGFYNKLFNIRDKNGNIKSNGVKERFTVLDLSFMEHTLTNDNLEDKERFKEPITVRDFLRSLIVLIFYTVFAVKLLRRIPALLGGSEGMSDDIRSVDVYKSTHLGGDI